MIKHEWYSGHMKFKVGYGGERERGFALPTILLVSMVMLTVLVATIAGVAASRVSLDSQYYNQLASQAAQSGVNRANECLRGSGYVPQWSTLAASRNLRPDSDCTGTTMTGSYVSAYVMSDGSSNVRTRYSVDAPSGTKIGSILRAVGVVELTRASAPDEVWRTYEQSLYMQIEPPEAVACPEGFVAVPGDTRFNTSDFCVGKYEAKNVGGKAVSQAAGTPWRSISQIDAAQAANDACTGCSLISDAQWLTVAHNVLNVSTNWSGGSVGNGYIFNGHNDNNPANPLAASTNDDDGYYGTNNSGGNQRRTLRLNNGEVIWDLAGNVWEWTSGTVNGGQPGSSGYSWREWNAITETGSLNPNPAPSHGTPQASGWTSSNGIGRLYSNSSESGLRGTLRGSFWNGGSTNAGVMALNFNDAPTANNNSLGFRIVYSPLSSIRCPEGHIPVPGNSTFGTKNFCVGKYEAKNVGGQAVSQASGAPWTNISQADAMSVAESACSSCRLIGEAEWMTIAHNIANVPSNWSGGSVGSGYIYSGHSDNSPAEVLAAGSNDSNGYYGTDNASGNQRRTLRLNNGEVIWDFAGNAAEWSSGLSPHTSHPKPIGGWAEWSSITDVSGLQVNPTPSYGTPAASGWTRSNGIGGVLTNTTGALNPAPFIRGGGITYGINAGIFALNLNSGLMYADVGFRTISDPISTVSCSSGFIPVPGDSRFGTNDFCVMKYEAKDVGGVAKSQPEGLPWRSISQVQANTVASATCEKCKLIGEAEWLTIAHNVMNVSSNWSGGAVGSGYIYRGHSDGSPAAYLEASSSDSDGYFGTGNTTGNQRRTLTLSNGEVIWDLAGNAVEWTSGQIGSGKPGDPGIPGRTWHEWSAIEGSGSMTPNPFPSFGLPAASGWTSTQGLGRVWSDITESTVRAFARGGSRSNGINAGIYSLNLGNTQNLVSADFGFRVVEIP